MERGMKRFTSLIESLARLATGVAFFTLIAAVVLQLAGRSGWTTTFVWTEEATRFALLFLAAFGVGLSFRSGDLVNVDIVCEKLPGAWPRRLRLVSALAAMGLCLTLIVPAWRYMSIGVRQTSPALGIRMDTIHASLLVLLIGLLVFAGLRVAGMLAGVDDGRPHRPEDDA